MSFETHVLPVAMCLLQVLKPFCAQRQAGTYSGYVGTSQIRRQGSPGRGGKDCEYIEACILPDRNSQNGNCDCQFLTHLLFGKGEREAHRTQR